MVMELMMQKTLSQIMLADSDRDNDGVADEFDAYPDDALRSEFEEESSNLFVHYNRCTSSDWNSSSCSSCRKKWK